jgi:hypothetical protein
MLLMRFHLYNGNKLDITQQIVIDKYVLKVLLREEYSERELNFHDIAKKETLDQLISQSSDIYAYSKIKDCKHYKDALTRVFEYVQNEKELLHFNSPIGEFEKNPKTVQSNFLDVNCENFLDKYLGLVPNDQIFKSQTTLLSYMDPGGQILFGETDWLKFEHSGKILFVAQRPTIKGVSWNMIDKVGGANGITKRINGLLYRVRLLSRKEWGDLIYRVHEMSIINKFSNFGVFMDDTELHIGQNNGSATWLSDNDDLTNSGNGAMYIGDKDIDTESVIFKSTVFDDAAWRPVLELIEY